MFKRCFTSRMLRQSLGSKFGHINQLIENSNLISKVEMTLLKGAILIRLEIIFIFCLREIESLLW